MHARLFFQHLALLAEESVLLAVEIDGRLARLVLQEQYALHVAESVMTVLCRSHQQFALNPDKTAFWGSVTADRLDLYILRQVILQAYALVWVDTEPCE